MKNLVVTSVTSLTDTRASVVLNPLQCYNPTNLTTIGANTLVAWGKSNVTFTSCDNGVVITQDQIVNYTFAESMANADDEEMLMLLV